MTERRLDLSEIGPRHFEVVEPGTCYRLTVPGCDVVFEVDRLQWHRQELSGELLVRCDLRGTDAIDGVLSVATFNLSSARARSERASLLEKQSRARDIPWQPLLEELCQRTLTAERTGEPAVALRDIAPPGPEDAALLDLFGFQLPRRHGTIIFGDGGATKSLLALYLAGLLSQQGYHVALFDWELDGIDHRDRYGSLFGVDMPANVFYTRCSRPMVHEVDRLQRIVRSQQIDYAIFDSVGFACHEAPETAAAALGYFQAVRRLGIGGLHIAHVTKGEQGDQRPFGSAFWHNSARATYYLKATEDASPRTVGVFCRKHSIAKYLPRPFAYEVVIDGDRTTFRRSEVADVPELAQRLTVRQRMRAALQHGSMSAEELAAALDVPLNTVHVTAKRGTEGRNPWLTRVPGPDGVYRIGLLARGSGHVN